MLSSWIKINLHFAESSYMQRASEKSLELNLAAEILGLLRGRLGFGKAFLLGLTQLEENKEGADSYLRIGAARVLIFQFKAPIGRNETRPYKFMLKREQHERLCSLASEFPQSVFYVLPFFATYDKLAREVPALADDTWLLPLREMASVTELFGVRKSKRICCNPANWTQCPGSEMWSLSRLADTKTETIPGEAFMAWYRTQFDHPLQSETPLTSRGKHDRSFMNLVAAVLE